MLRVSVDVGGTFTDVMALDESTGELFALKVGSTPRAPEEGMVSSVKRLISTNLFAPKDVTSIVHVSTVGSNLFLGQLGMTPPRTALLTTRGFRDVLEIGRQNRTELFNIHFQRPRILVPRALRLECTERVDSDGRIIQPINGVELLLLSKRLKASSVESVAVSFINSYVNPENEKQTKQILSQHLGCDIHLSSEVDPEHREYERTTTTVVNALLAPVVSKYLNSASQKLHALGLDVPIQVLSSSGGLVDVLEAKSRPVAVIESGPAAGVVGAAQLARILKFERVISLDMGGTTAKAGCVVDYEPLVTPEMEIRGAVHMGRVVKGSGYPVRYPCVDLAEVSAGGGTIIWGDEAGGLRVGPISAGAQPGPACYDTGGTSPTITDANLVLGRLGKSLIGGELNLNLERANEALKRVAAVVGLDPLRVAADSLKLINFHMARAVDIVSLERGFDPRGFSLVAFGGAGPMHAAELAEQVGIDKVVIPRFPGLFSAFGMLTTDMKYNYVKGFLKLFDDLPMQSLEQEFEEISASAMNDLKSRGFDVSNAKLSRSLDLRYLGQGYELEVSVDSTLDEQDIARKFEALHESVYGYRHDQTKLELTALRLTLSIPIMKPKIGGLESGSRPDTSVKYRDVWFGEDWVHTPIYPPNHPAEHLSGPAIVEGYDSTTVIPPRWRSSMAGMGAMLLEKSET